MKTTLGLIGSACVLTLLCHAQNDVHLPNYSIVNIGPNQRTIERVTLKTNEAGFVASHTNSYTELATGMHYPDKGQWVESNPEIVIQENGWGRGQKAPLSLQFAPNLKTSGAIELTTTQGTRFRSHILAIY